MSKKYDQKTITQACSLYIKGTPLRAILKETGIKSTSTVLFQCNPGYRRDMVARNAAWRQKNPEKWTAIWKRAHEKRKKKAAKK